MPEPSSPERAELRRIAELSRAQLAGENFPVALRLLPGSVRDHLIRVYCFARFVDDVGDEAAGDRTALLAAVAADLDAAEPVLEPVRAVQPLVQAGVSIEPLRDLVRANLQDQVRTQYETFADLLDYCQLSAAPIGRIILDLAGVTDPTATRRSDRVCAALQVLEHCQDVAEDARAGRIYLPAADRRAAQLDDAELTAARTSPALRKVVATQVERAETMLRDGPALARQLHGWARLAVAGYVGGGRATAAALSHRDFDVLAGTITPTKVRTAGYGILSVLGR